MDDESKPEETSLDPLREPSPPNEYDSAVNPPYYYYLYYLYANVSVCALAYSYILYCICILVQCIVLVQYISWKQRISCGF